MSIGWHKRALSHHAVPFFHFCCCVFSIEGSEYSYSKKLKLSENATVNEMRAAIRAAFPQLHGNFQLLRCEPNRRLVALPNDVDCPAKLKACVDMRRSALYVRPESVNISCWMFSVVTYKFLLCCAARPSLKPTCPTPHQFSNTPTITELLLLLYCYIFYSQQYMPDFCAVHRHHFIIIQHCPCLLFIPHYVIFVKCLRAATGGSGDWRWHSSCRTGGIFQWWFLHLWWAGNSGGDSAIFVDRIVESWKIWNLYSLKTTVHTHCTAYDGSASLL